MKNSSSSKTDSGAPERHPNDAFVNAYTTATRQAAEQSLKSLDASINWALTSTLGILAFTVHAIVIKGVVGAEERGLLLAILGIGFSMLVHFGIRAAKNYLNIVRFAKVEREALKYNLKLPGSSATALIAAIEIYHISWRSPLERWAIMKKVLLEFGFLYLVVIIGFMFWFVSRGLPSDKDWMWVFVFLISILSALIEMQIFSGSPYMKDPVPSRDVRSKA